MASRVFTQTYIVTRTADAIPVSGPMSHFVHLGFSTFAIRDNFHSYEGNTYKYAGGIAQSKLKNRITRHESRRPSPKVTGPRVPEANLRRSQSVGPKPGYERNYKVKKHTHDRMFVFPDNHRRNIFMKCVSVLS